MWKCKEDFCIFSQDVRNMGMVTIRLSEYVLHRRDEYAQWLCVLKFFILQMSSKLVIWMKIPARVSGNGRNWCHLNSFTFSLPLAQKAIPEVTLQKGFKVSISNVCLMWQRKPAEGSKSVKWARAIEGSFWDCLLLLAYVEHELQGCFVK